MMPTIAASTGAAFFPSASPAARPSSTTSTFSSTPAPTPSTASNAVPRGVSSMFSGWTSSSFAPSNLRCFCVETTVPTTRPICIQQSNLQSICNLQSAICNQSAISPKIPVINDPDDAGVDRRFDGMKREACFLAAHEEHVLAHARADRIHGHQRTPCRLPIGRERLDDQQLDPREILVLARRDDVSDHASDLH